MQSSIAFRLCKSGPQFGAFREPFDNEPDTRQKKSSQNTLTGFAHSGYSPTVKKRTYTVAEVIAELRKMQGKRCDSEFAAHLGITKAYLCDLYHGRRTPGEKVLSHLGLVKRQPEPFYEVA